MQQAEPGCPYVGTVGVAGSTSNLDRLILEIMAKTYNGNISGSEVHGVVAQVDAAARDDRASYDEHIAHLSKELKLLRDGVNQQSSLSERVGSLEEGEIRLGKTSTVNESQPLRALNLRIIGDRTRLEEKVRKLKASIVTLTNHTNVNESQTLRAVNLQLIGERTRLQEEVRGLKTSIVALQNTVSDKESQMSNKQLASDKVRLEDEIRKLKASIVTLTNTTEAGKEFHKLNSLNGSLRSDIKRLQAQVIHQPSLPKFTKAGETGKEVQKLKSLNGMLHGDKSRLEKEVQQLRTQNFGLMWFSGAGAEMQKLKSMNEELRGQVGRYRGGSQYLRYEVQRLKGEVAILQKRASTVPPSHAPTGPRVPAFGLASGREIHMADFWPPAAAINAYRPNYSTPAVPASKAANNDGRLSPYNSSMSGGGYQTQQSAPLVQPGMRAAPAASPPSAITSDPRLEYRLDPVTHKRSPSETYQVAATKKVRVSDPRLAATPSLTAESGDTQSPDDTQPTSPTSEGCSLAYGAGTYENGVQTADKHPTPMAADVSILTTFPESLY